MEGSSSTGRPTVKAHELTAEEGRLIRDALFDRLVKISGRISETGVDPGSNRKERRGLLRRQRLIISLMEKFLDGDDWG